MKRLLASCLVLLATLVVAGGCAAPSPTPPPTPAPPAVKVGEPTKAPAPAAAAPTVPPGQKELVLMGYGGVQEKAFKESIIPPFEQKYGVKVIFTTAAGGPAGAAKLIAQKDKPEVDVFYLSELGFIQLKQAGAIGKLDMARMPNYQNVYEIFRDPDLMGACQAMMPFGWVYNPKVFREKGFAPPTSWLDAWRPELKGRVALLSVTNSITLAGLPFLAKAVSGDPKNMDAAFNKVKELVPSVLTISAAPGANQDLFKQEEAWMMYDGRYSGVGLQNQGYPAEFVVPKEGMPYFKNDYVVPKGAPHTELAMEFINYALSPEVQAKWAEVTSFIPCIKNVNLPSDFAEKIGYGADKIAKLAPTDWNWIVANFDSLTERWNREIERK